MNIVDGIRNVLKELAGSLLNRAISFYDKESWDDYIDCYERALAIKIGIGSGDPNLFLYLNSHAEFLSAAGDFAGAKGCIETILELGLEVGRPFQELQRLGRILEQPDGFSGARIYYERILELQHDSYKMATILERLGKICKEQGKLSEAIDYYKRALESAYKDKGNLSEAIDYLDKESAIISSLQGLGDILTRQGDLSGARDYYKRAAHASRLAADIEAIPEASRKLYATRARILEEKSQ
ncbi:tetratricopeptide repeat protein [Candidatus Entotheonella palauensis]|uniref:MalT-like TPR region domain-containing protein n=1 Tax=Candidatus Entotheonella gemina TaxID=1429439 RepID=W4M558_9BACT|nr:tetratricopeptide repeat protein [Candidatus Entotheonella palauensis]ETX05081.1 MAG: hypothetical protein ETSY2_25035 [Candidatus Entotheonella gemina]